MASVEVWYVMVTALLAIATERRCPTLLYRWVCGTVCSFTAAAKARRVPEPPRNR